MRRSALLAPLLAALVAWSAPLAQAQERVLDDFANPAAWKVSATDDVKATLRSSDGPHGKALCLDYDFGRVTGYVTAQRALPIEYPARYEFALGVRGGGSPNAFQFKLVDAGGDNVWWVQRPEYRFPAEWQTLKLRQRQVQFAWGPTTDRTLRRSASVEFVIASSGSPGSGAGKGSACFDRLVLRRLPDTPPPIPAPVLSADGLGADFGVAREFGALALRWRGGTPPPRYAIELSDDGAQWQRVREVDGARGALHSHFVPDSEARYLRVVVAEESTRGRAALAAVEPRDAPDANTFFAQLARAAPRGTYPRAYVGEQSYWTVLGVDGARTASLLSEDGVLEPRPGVGALEPFLVDAGRVLGWADARATHALRDGDLPMPEVHWRFGGGERRGSGRGRALALDIEAFGAGTPEAPFAVARYTVRNLAKTPRRVALALAWRPFQANPPTQFLAHPGGASPVASLAWDGRALALGGTPRVRPL
ncbi:MAG TPA: discoidin domain-containing protein, partial [Burkholderiaceae bacterium]|nr:discoidin domain-containing protein [Burkholderiaceae bacterium]